DGAGTIAPPTLHAGPPFPETAGISTEATARAAAGPAATAALGTTGVAALPNDLAVATGALLTDGVVATGSGALLTNHVVVTGDDGFARCLWTLPGIGGAPSCLTVTATMRDDAGNPVSIPVVFHASLSVARQVAYEPGACDLLSSTSTVQDALDLLCKAMRQPGIVVEQVRTGDGQVLANDTDVRVGRLRHGLVVICDQDVAAALSTQPPR